MFLLFFWEGLAKNGRQPSRASKNHQITAGCGVGKGLKHTIHKMRWQLDKQEMTIIATGSSRALHEMFHFYQCSA